MTSTRLPQAAPASAARKTPALNLLGFHHLRSRREPVKKSRNNRGHLEVKR